MVRSIQWHHPLSTPHKPAIGGQRASKTRRRRKIMHAYSAAHRRRRPSQGSATERGPAAAGCEGQGAEGRAGGGAERGGGGRAELKVEAGAR
eukprot:3587274-Prymnesium_polylepis.1